MTNAFDKLEQNISVILYEIRMSGGLFGTHTHDHAKSLMPFLVSVQKKNIRKTYDMMIVNAYVGCFLQIHTTETNIIKNILPVFPSSMSFFFSFTVYK